jgi:hypothetical protein
MFPLDWLSLGLILVLLFLIITTVVIFVIIDTIDTHVERNSENINTIVRAYKNSSTRHDDLNARLDGIWNELELRGTRDAEYLVDKIQTHIDRINQDARYDHELNERVFEWFAEGLEHLDVRVDRLTDHTTQQTGTLKMRLANVKELAEGLRLAHNEDTTPRIDSLFERTDIVRTFLNEHTLPRIEDMRRKQNKLAARAESEADTIELLYQYANEDRPRLAHLEGMMARMGENYELWKEMIREGLRLIHEDGGMNVEEWREVLMEIKEEVKRLIDADEEGEDSGDDEDEEHKRGDEDEDEGYGGGERT